MRKTSLWLSLILAWAPSAGAVDRKAGAPPSVQIPALASPAAGLPQANAVAPATARTAVTATQTLESPVKAAAAVSAERTAATAEVGGERQADDLLEQAALARERFDGSSERPAVAIVGEETPEAVALAKAGGRLSIGDVHLVDKSQLSRQGRQIFVHGGATYDAEGNRVEVRYETPRPVQKLVKATRAEAPEYAEAREQIGGALARASRRMLRGKRIVLVGAGYANKKPFLESARRLGIKVILVDRATIDGQPNWAKDYVSEFIDVDLSKDPEKGLARAAALLRDSIKKNGKIDGITTYWEDDLVETSKLARDMGLRFHPVEATEIARSKHRTVDELSQRRAMPARFTARINSRAELEKLVADGRVPERWFLKPDAGAEALFTARDTDGRPVLEAYDDMATRLSGSDDPLFKGNKTLVLTQRLTGNELDDNFVLQNGRRLDFRPTDNWPTRAFSSKATGSSLPAHSLTEKELAAARERSVKEVTALGFTDGVFHVERLGEDLIEINARPGGSYTTDWNRIVHGIDEAEMLFLTAVGLPAFPVVPRKPKTHLEGAFVFTEKRGVVKHIALKPEAKALGLKAILEKKPGKIIDADNDRVAMIYADGATSAGALAKIGPDPSRWIELEVEPQP